MSTARAAVLLALLASLFVAPALAAPPQNPRADYIRSHYTKAEYRVPMRDGVQLFTTVYTPNRPGSTSPILLNRTPYSVGPYGADKYKTRLGNYEAIEKAGYVFVFQDVRGRFMSEGDFVNMRPQHSKHTSKSDVDESTDAWDTIDWLVKNLRGHNGKVGLWGISYPGFYAAAGAIDSHPALKAVVPQAPIADWFWDDMHRNGAFVLALSFRFFSIFGQPQEGLVTKWGKPFEFPTRDAYRFYLEAGPLKELEAKYLKGGIAFWTAMAEHPNYDDFWQSRNLLPHLSNVDAAVLTVGGWFDTEDLFGPLEIYRSIEKLNRGGDNTLVMGPWSHGGWVRTPGTELGDQKFGFETSAWYQEHVELPFLEHHLKGGAKPALPEALVFETGANRWREFDAWPPREAGETSMYFGDNGTLSTTAPQDAGVDSFTSDPARPVPYSVANGTRLWRGYPGEDQRFASYRPDVLVYESEVLTEDLTIAGPIEAELFVSTDQSAADWVVKVIDVQPGMPPSTEPKHSRRHPGGEHLLVRAEAMRGRFRNSFETPEPFEPGKTERVAFRLHDVLHTFPKGHRVMVHVQSSWFPLIDRNPQKYVANIFEATRADFVKATHTVHRAPAQASRLTFRRLPATN